MRGRHSRAMLRTRTLRTRRPAGRVAGPARVVEHPVDHRTLGNEGDDAHLRAALRAPEGIDFEDLPEQLGPAPPRFAERERHRLRHRLRDRRRWRVCGRRAPGAAGAIGVVAIVARHHLALVRHVRHHSREERQWIHRLGARGGAVSR